MTQPTFDLAINPAAVMPEPGIFPKEQILKIVRTCVRPLRTFRGVQVVWHTDPRPMLGNDTTERAWIVVSLGSTGGIGCEELRTQLNVDTNDREALLVAQRKFTMTLRAYSLDPKLEAFDVLNRVRFYINTAPVRLLMVPTIALIDYEDVVVYTDRTTEGRSLLAASLDLKMAYVEAADPEEQGEQGFVESASGMGTLLP